MSTNEPPAGPGPPDEGQDLDALGYVEPDPDEPPPLELGRATGDVLPFATLAVLVIWSVLTLVFAWRALTGDTQALIAWGANTNLAPASESVWRLVSSTFLHSGFAHVAMNAISLLMFGAALEAMFAPGAFAIVYVLGGAAASAGSLLWHTSRHPGEPFTSVGGSGAVFALGGALLAAAVHLRGRLAVGRARALAAGALFLLVQSLTAGFAKLGTDNAAHASGLVAGLLIGLALPVAPALGGPPRSAGVGVLSALVTLVGLGALAYAVVQGARTVW